jgi:hypothetical protein
MSGRTQTDDADFDLDKHDAEERAAEAQHGFDSNTKPPHY